MFCSEPGYVEFEETAYLVKESIGKAELKVVRINGADGRITVRYRTKDINAVATKDYQRKSERPLWPFFLRKTVDLSFS